MLIVPLASDDTEVVITAGVVMNYVPDSCQKLLCPLNGEASLFEDGLFVRKHSLWQAWQIVLNFCHDMFL